MAVTIKEKVNPEVKDPKNISEEPPPQPETLRMGEDEAATTSRNLRDKLARDRLMLENEERKTRGPRVGHNIFYNSTEEACIKIISLSWNGRKEEIPAIKSTC